ncbi:helix-turn-helix transcriptional regulator [Halopiger djelfimassiliensis]|uniref:helix-turn-helix transcriptional regulator n=1 Tax=Halopiger djelfimassiliensis TaxID=1293047 RepID=UPI00067827F8|nr:hypothetical protein [Halopiger djelfimassiliensis]
MTFHRTDLTRLIEQRHAYLQAIATTPQSKQDLTDTLETPRSTLDDIVRELETADLVEYRDGKWHATVLGQIALEMYVDYNDRIERLLEAAPIIEQLPTDTPVGSSFLVGADVYVASNAIPDEVIRVFLEAVESANWIRCLTPLVLSGYVEEFYQSATAGEDYRLDIVLPVDVYKRVHDLHPEQAAKTIDDERIEFYSGAVPVTFSLWIADDDHAGIIVYANNGIQGILINDTADALTWAIEQYDRIKEDAEPLVTHEHV